MNYTKKRNGKKIKNREKSLNKVETVHTVNNYSNNKYLNLSHELVLTLILALVYGIFTFILIYYNLGKYFVFGNIFGLVLIIYQIYLLVKPVSKNSLLKDIFLDLKSYTKKLLTNIRNDFENVNAKLRNYLYSSFNKIKERKRLIHHLPSHFIREKITKKEEKVSKRNKKFIYLFYLILGLLFFNISLYYGLSLDREVFIYGYIGFVSTISTLILILYFVYRIIKRLLFRKNG
ncbi:MAG: hypothetical protein AABX29_01485 [Nanoarchaeota archaeon]